jgi:hypothetical protein
LHVLSSFQRTELHAPHPDYRRQGNLSILPNRARPVNPLIAHRLRRCSPAPPMLTGSADAHRLRRLKRDESSQRLRPRRRDIVPDGSATGVRLGFASCRRSAGKCRRRVNARFIQYTRGALSCQLRTLPTDCLAGPSANIECFCKIRAVLPSVNLVGSADVGQQQVVAPHQLVGDRHQLAEHLVRRSRSRPRSSPGSSTSSRRRRAPRAAASSSRSAARGRSSASGRGPTFRLNSWSVPPSSTSASSATES